MTQEQLALDIPDARKAARPSIVVPQQMNTGVTSAQRVFGLFNNYASLAFMLPWSILEYIEVLARYNPDYSQAINNVKTLANSGYDLFVEGRSDLETRQVTEMIHQMERTVQGKHGGIDGLIGKLLDQAATYGAMCGEWILNDELTDVIDFVDVNPRTIRFFWEEDEQDWHAYQKVNAEQAKKAAENGQKVRNGNCVQLNNTTFHYFAFDAAAGSPYGVPPFLAALKPISIQSDMNESMAKIAKKLGMLGLVDISVEQLSMLPQETPEQFTTRATQLLTDYSKVLEEMVESGGMAHYNDAELKTYNITGNAAGATNIWKQNEEQVFSGLKSMPSVQGRSYSTTETYAGVAYDIIIRDTYKYQKAVKRMVESGFWLKAILNGKNPKTLSMTFKSNKSLHRLQDAQSRLLEIKCALMMWASGINDQDGFAQELGYNTVATEYKEIPDTPILGNASPGGGAATTSTDDQTRPPARSDEMATLEGALAGLEPSLVRQMLEELDEIKGVLGELSDLAAISGNAN